MPDDLLVLSAPETLLEELDLGSARGGKRKSADPLWWEVERELVESDLAEIRETLPLSADFRPIDKIRQVHHQLAQLLAKGESQVSACLITGYSQSYVSGLVNYDPAFQELLAYYSTQREQIFIDVMEQMRALGIETLEMLRDSIREDPGKWSRREMMELAELMLVKPLAAQKGQGGIGAGTQIGTLQVSFVSPGSVVAKAEGEAAPRPLVTIDGTSGEIE